MRTVPCISQRKTFHLRRECRPWCRLFCSTIWTVVGEGPRHVSWRKQVLSARFVLFHFFSLSVLDHGCWWNEKLHRWYRTCPGIFFFRGIATPLVWIGRGSDVTHMRKWAGVHSITGSDNSVQKSNVLSARAPQLIPICLFVLFCVFFHRKRKGYIQFQYLWIVILTWDI